MGRATLWITNNGRAAHVIGANHAGLELDTDDEGSTYVTWDGAGRNQRSVGCGPSFKGQVAWRLGHQQRKGRDGNIENNEYARMTTAADEGFTKEGAFQNPKFHGFPAYSCDIPVSDLAEQGFDNFTGANNLWGLSIEPIRDWWETIMAMSPDDPKRIYSKLGTWEDFDKGKGTNCCGMVALALGIGGLSGFAEPPSNIIYQGSRTLITWVEKAVKQINKLNTERNLILSQPGYRDANAWNTLPSLEAWKAESKVTFGGRKDQIAEIDKILGGGTRPQKASYSTLVSVLSAAASADLKKYVDLYELCFNHLVSKPTSDRRRAVLKLAKTVEKVSNEILDGGRRSSDSSSRSSASSFRSSGSFSSFDLR